MEVRDPLHGGIGLTEDEAAVVHQPFLQRLRHIRQVGFSHIPFPSANHTRFSHVIGVMHLAGEAFDRAYRGWSFQRPDARARFRAAVRLAALCHDLGHPPFSHCAEFAMPTVGELGIPWYRDDGARQATHEDYTIAVLALSGLGRVIDARFPCSARHVAQLIAPEIRSHDDFFRDGGLDHRRLLSQLISSELDVDRLDYLVRDAYFSGARYGMVDVAWILSHLGAHTADGQVSLSLGSAAIYAFEDFLVSRHHMFLQVYFHHTSVIYEEMLRRWVAATGWRVPSDLDAYLGLDDVALEMALRASEDPWARRIVRREVHRRVVERHGRAAEANVEREAEQLAAAGIETIVTSSTGRLSRYALGRRRMGAPRLFVRDELPGQRARARTLREASTVFERYAEEHHISRVYVAPEDRERALRVLGLPSS